MQKLLRANSPITIASRGYIKPARPALNPHHPMSRLLVGCWMLGEGTGTFAEDLSPHAHHGTRTNFATDPWVGGRNGGVAPLFDATDDYVELGTIADSRNIIFESAKPFSICWSEYIWTDTNLYPSRFCIGYNDIGVGIRNCLVLRGKPGGGYDALTCGPSAAATTARSTAAPSTTSSVGIWRDFVIAGDNIATHATYALFVDGVEQTLVLGPSFGGVTTNRIGHDGSDNGADAVIDHVRFYSGRRLTLGEAQWLHAEPSAGVENYRPNYFTGTAASGFQAAWARNANAVVSTGARVA